MVLSIFGRRTQCNVRLRHFDSGRLVSFLHFMDRMDGSSLVRGGGGAILSWVYHVYRGLILHDEIKIHKKTFLRTVVKPSRGHHLRVYGLCSLVKIIWILFLRILRYIRKSVTLLSFIASFLQPIWSFLRGEIFDHLRMLALFSLRRHDSQFTDYFKVFVFHQGEVTLVVFLLTLRQGRLVLDWWK